MRDCDGNSAEVSVLVMGDKRIKPLKMGNVRPLFWVCKGLVGVL